MPVPPVVGLDSPLPPPPLTSFLGCRSRMMASLRSFFSRRQTDRTTLTFGSGVFLLKQLPQFIWWQPFYRGVPVKASRKAVCVRVPFWRARASVESLAVEQFTPVAGVRYSGGPRRGEPRNYQTRRKRSRMQPQTAAIYFPCAGGVNVYPWATSMRLNSEPPIPETGGTVFARC
jgi:hypothetical protein